MSDPSSSPPRASAQRPRWLLALGIAVAGGVYQFLRTDPDEAIGLRIGIATGAFVLPMLAASVAFLLWRKPMLPPLVTAIVVGLSIVGGNASQARIAEVRTEYLEQLDRDREGLVARMHLTADLDSAAAARRWADDAARHHAALGDGGVFLDLLEAADIDRAHRDAAWLHLQQRNGFDDRREVARLLLQLAQAASERCEQLQRQPGAFVLDDAGEAVFADAVDDAVRDTVRRCGDAIRAARRELAARGVR